MKVNTADKKREDIWTGQEITLENLQPFGHWLYYRVHQHQSRLQPRYLPSRLMGYQTESENNKDALNLVSV